MMACGFRLLFLLTPSSIIPVSPTLRLHFEAHYRGRGDGPKEELLQKKLEEGKLTGTAGLVAIAGLQLKLSSLGFSSSTLFLSGKHNFDSTFASLCAFARLDWFPISGSLGVHGRPPARPPACLVLFNEIIKRRVSVSRI